MGIFGLGSSAKKTAKKTAAKGKKPAKGRSKDAQEVLAKMKAKKDSGDCAFC